MTDIVNNDVLQTMRPNYGTVVEIGSSSGALAKAYCELSPHCHYIGVEIDDAYVTASRHHCAEVFCCNIEQAEDELFSTLNEADCWIFADVLEHLYDPWLLLGKIRERSSKPVDIIASIPNLQNWALQRCINSGQFYYMDSGLLDRTHIRWFTRATITSMFENAGFRIEVLSPRVLHMPDTQILAAIRQLALACGNNPDSAVQDAIPFQYIVRATTRKS